MSPLTLRIWLTTIVIAVCALGTTLVHSGYVFEVLPLNRPLASIPMELDGWRGEDVPMDEEILKILKADSTIQRVYRDSSGNAVIVSVSTWCSPENVTTAAPHLPKICYTNSGWKLLSERQVLVASDHQKVPLDVLLFEQKGEQIVVGFWYQLGTAKYNSDNQARQIHRQLWGQSKWPATIKVLLQTSAMSIDDGLPRIERFATQLDRELADL